MTIRNVIYMVCGAAGFALLLYKIPDLRRRWRNPGLWSMCGTFFFPSVAVFASAPAFDAWFSQVTATPNFVALLAYCLLVAFAASALALVLFWRYPAERAWSRVKWVLVVYGGAIASMIVLFFTSSLVGKRQDDFDTYYATQPTVAAFLMIYYWGTLIGCAALACHCWQATHDTAVADVPWLRRGLRLYSVAALFPVAFCVVKITAVVSVWYGVRALVPVSTTAPLIAAFGFFPLGIGFLLSRWNGALGFRRWLARWRIFWRLRPLHRTLHEVHPDAVFIADRKSLDPHHRVRRQVIELADFHWALRSSFDPAVAAAARRLATEARLPEDQVAATVKAAQLKAAYQARRQGGSDLLEPSYQGHSAAADRTRDGIDLSSEYRPWLQIAHAFQWSPLVDAAIAEGSGRRSDRQASPVK